MSVLALVKSEIVERKNPAERKIVTKPMEFDMFYRMITGASKINVSSHVVMARLTLHKGGPIRKTSASNVVLWFCLLHFVG